MKSIDFTLFCEEAQLINGSYWYYSKCCLIYEIIQVVLYIKGHWQQIISKYLLYQRI